MGSIQRGQVIEEYCRRRDRQAAEAVVEAYWPLLRQWTRRYRAYRVASEDLLQIATVGLLKSLTRFDATRSGFDTYAYHCVNGELRHYVRDYAQVIRVPRTVWGTRQPPVILSLDALLGGLEEGHRSREIGRDEPGLGRAEDRIYLWEMMRDLDPRQGAALLLWIGFQLPQHAVAAILGITQNSVSRLCARAMRTLRARAEQFSAS